MPYVIKLAMPYIIYNIYIPVYIICYKSILKAEGKWLSKVNKVHRQVENMRVVTWMALLCNLKNCSNR